jgi:hypothetical protein
LSGTLAGEVVVPFVAYVHASDHDPRENARPTWEPNLRVWRWIVAAAVLGYASAHTQGALSAVLMLIVFACVCQAAAEALPTGAGLREYRQ